MNQKNILAKPLARTTPLLDDSSYRLLFSHPRLVQDLLTGFIKPGWLDGVDLTKPTCSTNGNYTIRQDVPILVQSSHEQRHA